MLISRRGLVAGCAVFGVQPDTANEDVNLRLGLTDDDYQIGSSFSPNGKWFGTVCGVTQADSANSRYKDRALVIWNSQSGKLQWVRVRDYFSPLGFAFSSDSKRLYLAVCRNINAEPKSELRVMDVNTGKEIERRAVSGCPHSVAMAPNGKVVALVQSNHLVSLRRTADLKEVASWKLVEPMTVSAIATFSGDSSTIAIVVEPQEWNSSDPKIQIVSIVRNADPRIRTLTAEYVPHSVVLSNNGKHVVYGPVNSETSDGWAIAVVDLGSSAMHTTKLEVREIPNHMQMFNDGNQLVLSGHGETSSGNISYHPKPALRPTQTHNRPAVAFTLDGRFFASGSEPQGIYRMSDGKLMRVMERPTLAEVMKDGRAFRIVR